MVASPIPVVIFSTLIRHGSSVALEALERVLSAMYADRLNSLCAGSVREAKDGDRLERAAATDPHDPVWPRSLAVSAAAGISACHKWLPKP